MGGLVADGYVPHVQEQLNSRFIGEALDEMVQFQKEFKVFSPQHTLQMSFGLLNIAPVGEADRQGFFKYLKLLKRTGSSIDGKASRKNGHDQIIASLQANLESGRAMPVFFTWHPGEHPKGIVQITSGDRALSFSSKGFLTISVPTIGAHRPKAGKRKK
ncbi:hypothetical protein ACVIGB_003513 [Bradyrhizobium sp. USDA 4341]|jgi:hypothetical protein|uniref:Uncharacterized protein n=1 Tax=Bradyrhizobium erythrophlei TaxID=1437360 RepID=A0A1H4V0U3_9BRAD|nr:hypothetical protein [Bradyrhizobium erythrophlei]SEC74565.1 hypothetical protein SAMN05444164_2640 [Bradyrhizobium erythrophlei]